MRQRFSQLWQQENITTHALKVAAWCFGKIVKLRKTAYQRGFLSTTNFSVPIIVVGNITTGGVGKSPLVAVLANWLKKLGFKPGLVSRGYGGQSTSWPQQVMPSSNPDEVGDEPVMLACLTQCPMVVDPNRVRAVKTLLEKSDCNIVLSDDGLQHYALGRDIEIAVVDGQRRFGNELLLPAGPLREPIERLQAVDFVVVNGEQADADEYAMQFVGGACYNLIDPEKKLDIKELQGVLVHAVAGIGNPERFFSQLEALGLTIQRHPYPDHYRFRQSDIDFGANVNVIMTEKDAVKCRKFAGVSHWCLPIIPKLDPQFLTKLQQKLDQVVELKQTDFKF
jgi:tetraacyldisaccharide 4'-kinase